MKKFYITLNLLLFSFCTYSQHWEWAIYDTVSYMVSDSFGNVFTAGNYKIKRYNTEGNVVWQKQLSGNFSFKGMVTDSAGDLYILFIFILFQLILSIFLLQAKRIFSLERSILPVF